MLHENELLLSVTKDAPLLAFMEPWTLAPPPFGELESGPHLSPEDLGQDLMAQAGRNLRARQKVPLLLSEQMPDGCVFKAPHCHSPHTATHQAPDFSPLKRRILILATWGCCENLISRHHRDAVWVKLT